MFSIFLGLRHVGHIDSAVDCYVFIQSTLTKDFINYIFFYVFNVFNFFERFPSMGLRIRMSDHVRNPTLISVADLEMGDRCRLTCCFLKF